LQFYPTIRSFSSPPRKIRHANGHSSTAKLRLDLQKAMQTHAAVFRTGELLQEGCKKVDDIFTTFVWRVSR